MRTIKVQELLAALKTHELAAFESYLLSPLFNKNTAVVSLYKILISEEGQKKIEDKKGLFKILFPGKRYDDKQMRYLFSYLSGHLENFFVLRELDNDPQQSLLLLRKSLTERKAPKAHSFARYRFSQLNSEESVSRYLLHYQSAELDHQVAASRVRHADYVSILNNLDHFYFLRKLQLHCELINLRNVFNKETEMFLIDSICELILRNNFFQSPIIEVYYEILMVLSAEEKTGELHFKKVLALINRHHDLFSVEDLNNAYQYVKNFCIRLINKGRDDYRMILFDIYKTILSNKRLLNHGDFSPWEFKNIVTLGLRLHQEKWVKEFIRKTIHFLPSQERANALTYNSAMLSFYQKNYRQTLKHLQEVEFTDLYYQLDSRSILLKVYFETDDAETMLHHISAFKIFIRRNKLVSAYQREIYLNFIRFTLKIFRAGTSLKKLQMVQTDIQQQANISDKSWLLEKIEELSQ